MTEPDLPGKKQQIRRLLQQNRAALPEIIRRQASAAITAKVLALEAAQRAQSIFIFISYGNEVDTHELLTHFLDQGKQLAVPKILPDKSMAAIPFTAWEDLAPGELGILTPRASQPDRDHFDLVITPGLGFTESGSRIGYGRGYYDKWFAQHSTGEKIAVCFETQILDELPVEQTDVAVDRIVTESRIITCRS